MGVLSAAIFSFLGTPEASKIDVAFIQEGKSVNGMIGLE
jgi:hypothetical protein